MKKEIIINATSSEIRVALTEDSRLAELFLELPDKERHVGSIFLGRVERVVQGMNAAFVDIGLEQHAFLHFSDAANAGEDFTDLLTDDDDDEESDGQKDSKGKGRDSNGSQHKGSKGGKGGGRGKGGSGQKERGGQAGKDDKGNDGDSSAGTEGPDDRNKGQSKDGSDKGRSDRRDDRGGRKGRPDRPGRHDNKRSDERNENAGSDTQEKGDSRDDRGRGGNNQDRRDQADDRKGDGGDQNSGGEEGQSGDRPKRSRRRPNRRKGKGRPDGGGDGNRPDQQESRQDSKGEKNEGGNDTARSETDGSQDGNEASGNAQNESGDKPKGRSGRRRGGRGRSGRGRRDDSGQGADGERRSEDGGNDPDSRNRDAQKNEQRGSDRPVDAKADGHERRDSGVPKGDDSRAKDSESGESRDRATDDGKGGGRSSRRRPKRSSSMKTASDDNATEAPSGTAAGKDSGNRTEPSGRDDSGSGRRDGGSGDAEGSETERKDSPKSSSEGDAPKTAAKAKRRPPRKKKVEGDGPDASGSPKSSAGSSSSKSAKANEGPKADDKGGDSKSEGTSKSAGDDSSESGAKKSSTTKKRAPRKRPAKKKASPDEGAPKSDDKKSSGDDGGKSSGPQIMDAKLPTFQTKRHGEVTIALEKGQDVLVQVTRESYSSKGVKVSTKISLPGRFLVLLPLDPVIGISRKVVEVKERRRLRGVARKILPEGFGCIIRTVAQDKDSEMLEQELQMLLDRWREIEENLKTIDQPGLLYKDQSVANTVMRDLFTPDVSRVVIDNKSLFSEIRDYVSWAAPSLLGKVEHFNGKGPIFQQHGIEKELDKMLAAKVWLNTGGYIILEQTEAMMVIDVNSGRYAKDKEQEINALRTNLESAREIARQIRLRDIGGLIIVDFIDLYDEKNRKKVYDELKKEMGRDRAKSVVLPMTQFGLVQMTRQRVRQQLVQTMSEPCPTCHGKGIVQSKSTVSRRIERWLSHFRSQTREFRLTLTANPKLIEYLTEGDSMSRLTKMMLRHFVRIKVVPDESLPVEDFRFFSIRRQEDVTEEYMPK